MRGARGEVRGEAGWHKIQDRPGGSRQSLSLISASLSNFPSLSLSLSKTTSCRKRPLEYRLMAHESEDEKLRREWRPFGIRARCRLSPLNPTRISMNYSRCPPDRTYVSAPGIHTALPSDPTLRTADFRPLYHPPAGANRREIRGRMKSERYPPIPEERYSRRFFHRTSSRIVLINSVEKRPARRQKWWVASADRNRSKTTAGNAHRIRIIIFNVYVARSLVFMAILCYNWINGFIKFTNDLTLWKHSELAVITL